LKASNEAKSSETNKANTSAEQSKIQAVRIVELVNQLKASNEAKTNETNKANTSEEHNKTQTARIVELENQLKASNEAKANSDAKANDKQKLAEQLIAQKGELIESHKSELKLNSEQELLLSEQKAEHKKNKEWAESLNRQLKKLELVYAEKLRSADLSQKMLAKSMVDLDSLREQYSKKLTSENNLMELVKDLREKLLIASQYYFQLQQEHPELLLDSSSENK